MVAGEIPYSVYLEHPFPTLNGVRVFGAWQILASTDGGRCLLLLVNAQTQEDVVVCEYETWAERQQDILMLRRLRPGDDLGGAFPARQLPQPPPAPAANALPQAVFSENQKPFER